MRLLPILFVLLCLAPLCHAVPSQEFPVRDGEVYDQWGLCRTRAWGPDGFFQVMKLNSQMGFRPAVVFESLGERANAAFELGENLSRGYPDPIQRAQRIFRFVRDHVRYTPDVDQFNFEDFAQNADELAEDILRKGWAEGDCEDYAALLAVMFYAAGLRSAVVLAPNHAAVLVYLPDFKGANVTWELGGERGWVWAEATGATNPLGWTPERYLDGINLAAYEIKPEPVEAGKPPAKPVEWLSRKPGTPVFGMSPFFSVIFFMWMLSALRRARR